MANKLYVKDGVNFEGISMQEGKTSQKVKIIGFIIIIIVVISLVLFLGSLFLNQKQQSDKSSTISVSPTSSPKQQPTDLPTASPSISSVQPTKKVSPSPTIKVSPSITVTGTEKKVGITISVLNGSGTKGAAKNMSTVLTDLGYTVSSTGNADVFTYSGITINAKKSKSQVLNDLKKALVAKGYLITSATTSLDETSPTDAVVIVGAE